MRIDARPFGKLPGGTPATLYTLVSGSGSRLAVADYGATLVSLEVPDRDGRLEDVVLGFDRVEGYVASRRGEAPPFHGATIGRYGNRIARGRFVLDGETHQLVTNEGSGHLHGGHDGFDTHRWQAEPFESGGDVGVRLGRVSPDGEQGYPGTLDVSVTYTLTADDRVVLDYRATTEAPTIVNLTHHSYFNLSGDATRTVHDHELSIQADVWLPVDEQGIPTGERCPVAGTPFDLRRPRALRHGIGADHPQLRRAGGYDHAFLLRDAAVAARLRDPQTGRVLTVETTEPSLQLYTGNHLRGTGKGGVPHRPWAGVCLEAQHPPDAPNQPRFPSTVLRPGEIYRSQTVYAFSVDA